MTATLITLSAPLVSNQLDYGSGRVKWWAFRETTGTTPAVFDLYDGSPTGLAQPLIPFSLGPGESTRDFVAGHLIPYYVGLWLQVTSGSVLGSVMVSELDDHGEAMPVVVIDNFNVLGGS